MSDDEYEYHYSDESDMDDNDDDDNDNGFDDDNEDDEDDNDGFDYSSEEEMNTGDIEVQMENEYYNAKGDKDTDKDAALEQFENVIRIETTGGDDGDGGDGDGGNGEKKPYGKWSFKALKQSMKLRLRHKEYDEARACYQRLLECITNNDGEIAPSTVEKGVNGMLERVSILLFQNNNSSKSSSPSDANTNSPQNLAWYVYDSTLNLFHPQNGACRNERLWFKTNLKYGQLLYENHQTSKLQIVIRDLLHSSQDVNTTKHNNSNSNPTHSVASALKTPMTTRMNPNSNQPVSTQNAAETSPMCSAKSDAPPTSCCPKKGLMETTTEMTSMISHKPAPLVLLTNMEYG